MFVTLDFHPPKPAFAFCVGVVGHRPNRLREDSRQKIILEVSRVITGLHEAAAAARARYSDFFAAGSSQISLVTALAEGADRIVAEAAVNQGWALNAVLPFAMDAYKASFDAANSHDEFENLIAHAKSVLILPGTTADKASAYQSLGTHLLSLADILVSVWDGGPSEGKGGTTEIITLAMRLGIPVVQVDANGETVSRVLLQVPGALPGSVNEIDEFANFDLATALPKVLDEIIRPPVNPQERKAILAYYSERRRRFNCRFEFPLLMTMLGLRLFRCSDFFPPKPATLATREARLVRVEQDRITKLATAYGWADAVGLHFSQTFRSAFVFNFIVAAIAVVVAVAVPANSKKELIFVGIEFALVFLVVVNTFVGRRLRWHQRWLEAREVTERLRVALVFWPLGMRSSTLFSTQEPTWMGWYSRAVIRWQGIRSAELNAEALADIHQGLDRALTEQCRFHEKNRLVMHRLDRRLEHFGLVLFILTLAALLLHFASAYFHLLESDSNKHLMVALTAGLPALGSAVYGIRMIGDFDGIAKRSERTHTALTKLIALSANEPVELRTLCARGSDAADIMLGDVETWRLSVESRPLTMPG